MYNNFDFETTKTSDVVFSEPTYTEMPAYKNEDMTSTVPNNIFIKYISC